VTCITLRGLGGDVDDGDAVAVGVVFAHPQFVCATTQPFDAGGGRDPACSLWSLWMANLCVDNIRYPISGGVVRTMTPLELVKVPSRGRRLA